MLPQKEGSSLVWLLGGDTLTACFLLCVSCRITEQSLVGSTFTIPLTGQTVVQETIKMGN